MISDYIVLEGENPQELTNLVASALQDGWELYGSPFSSFKNSTNYCQAMVMTSVPFEVEGEI